MFDRPNVASTLLFALALLPAAAATAEAADVTITDAKIEAGKLVIAGKTVAPNMRVRLDGQSGAGFNVTSTATGAFEFKLVYLPSDCIVTLQKLTLPATLGPPSHGVVADCGPRGVSPRGAWDARAPYLTNDLVTHAGSSWRAKRDNTNKSPVAGADWELFAAKGETGPAGEQGTAMLSPPDGPAGGDLTGTYPNPLIRNDAVTSGKIVAGAVITSRIADSAVTSAKIQNNSVTSDDLASDSLTTNKIAPGAVTESRLANGAVTGAKILDGSIQSADIEKAPPFGSGGLNGDVHIIDGTISQFDIGQNQVTGFHVADFSLSNQDIGVLFAQVNADATIANSSGGVTAIQLGTGVYEVDFGRDISSCAFVMTQGEAGVGGAPGAITGVTDRAGNAEAVFATTRTNANVLVDRAFQLVVVC